MLGDTAGAAYLEQVLTFKREKKAEASFTNLTCIEHLICTLLTTKKVTVDGADIGHLVDHFVINAYVIKPEDVVHLSFLRSEDFSQFADLVVQKVFEKHERQPTTNFRDT